MKIMQNNKDGSRNSFLEYLPHYAGLEWRIDAIVGSRAMPLNEVPNVSPIVTMKLKLRFPSINNVSDNNNDTDVEGEADHDVILQTDPANLCHITYVLENALKEARSQQLRKLQRRI